MAVAVALQSHDQNLDTSHPVYTYNCRYTSILLTCLSLPSPFLPCWLHSSTHWWQCWDWSRCLGPLVATPSLALSLGQLTMASQPGWVGRSGSMQRTQCGWLDVAKSAWLDGRSQVGMTKSVQMSGHGWVCVECILFFPFHCVWVWETWKFHLKNGWQYRWLSSTMKR